VVCTAPNVGVPTVCTPNTGASGLGAAPNEKPAKGEGLGSSLAGDFSAGGGVPPNWKPGAGLPKVKRGAAAAAGGGALPKEKPGRC